MTYAETLSYLFAQLPMYSRIGAAAYKADLDNTIALLAEVGGPQKRFKSIHVAGTNGKGSVSHMLAAILQTAGYKTGLYTSPHLVDFRERIRINGEMIPEASVIAFTKQMRSAVESIQPSFFELTVAMAFEYFAEQQVDIAVIETGLGGRLDSTNVIDPELSIITNIGWDHMNLLGDTLEKIAFEKAGIIKPNRPVVIGEWLQETKPIFEQKAAEAHASPTWAGEHIEIVRYRHIERSLEVSIRHKDTNETTDYQMDLPGQYQLKNLITVLESVRQLNQQHWKISTQHVQQALKQVKTLTGFWGRWDVMDTEPRIILDVTHNVHGLDQVLQHLRSTTYDRLHVVLGMVNDKDIQAFLEKLPVDASYYFTQASIPRALPVASLKEKAQRIGLKGDAFGDVNTSIEKARSSAQPNDLILVIGSIFLIGEVNRAALR